MQSYTYISESLTTSVQIYKQSLCIHIGMNICIEIVMKVSQYIQPVSASTNKCIEFFCNALYLNGNENMYSYTFFKFILNNCITLWIHEQCNCLVYRQSIENVLELVPQQIATAEKERERGGRTPSATRSIIRKYQQTLCTT